jgi:hypothetical protein
LASYAFHIASITGWGYHEIMDEIPLAAGLQIIDADLYSKGVERVYSRGNTAADFDSLRLIDETFLKLGINNVRD